MIGEALQHFTETILNKKTTIMSVASAIGVLATFIFTIKANKKAVELEIRAREEKGDDLSSVEKFVAEAPAYIVPAIIAAGTISIIGVNDIANKEEKNKLLEGALLASGLYYDRIAAEKNAEVEDKVQAQLVQKDDIPKLVPEGWNVFYDTIQKRYFVERWENVLNAEIELEKMFAYEGAVSMNVWYRALNNPAIPPTPETEIIGWSKWHATRMDIVPPLYIDVLYHRITRCNENPYTEITFPQPPEPNYLNDL